MSELTLPERLMPVGVPEVFSFRQRILAGFAATAGELWPEARVSANMPEETVWQRIRKLVDARPDHKQLLRKEHPIVHAWLYGQE